MARGEALVLEPAKQVHTFGMKYPIDVVFCNSRGTILHARRHLRPGRLTRVVLASRFVVELGAGSLPEDLGRGDRLRLVQRSVR